MTDLKNGSTALLVAYAKQGHTGAIAELYTRTYASLYQLARVLVREEAAALGILQEAYLSGIRNLNRLQNAEQFPLWMKSVVISTARDALNRSMPGLFTAPSPYGTGAGEWMEDKLEKLPEAVLDRNDAACLLQEVLAPLPDDVRMVTAMYYASQMTTAKIADTLSCTEDAVRSRLSAGRMSVENSVRKLEGNGIPLHSLAPIPYLLWLIRINAGNPVTPSDQILAYITAHASPLPDTSVKNTPAKKTGTHPAKKKKRRKNTFLRRLFTALLFLAVIAGVAGYIVFSSRSTPPAPPAQTEPTAETTIETTAAVEAETETVENQEASPEAVAEPETAEASETAEVAETAEPETEATEVITAAAPAEDRFTAFQELRSTYAAAWAETGSETPAKPDLTERYPNLRLFDGFLFHYSNEELRYALHDLNGDGEPEMLMAIVADDGEALIFDALMFDGSKPVSIMEGSPYFSFTILKDGVIVFSDFMGQVQHVARIDGSGSQLVECWQDTDLRSAYSLSGQSTTRNGGKLTGLSWLPVK